MAEQQNGNGHIADMIKQAVGKMAENEETLREHLLQAEREIREERAANDALTREKQELERQLHAEKEARRALEDIVSKVAELVR